VFKKANGIHIRYQFDGPEDAPLVTMSHSLAATHRMWDWQMPALQDKYRVLRYDTRGHGETDAPDGPYDLETLASDLFGLLDALEIESTHFVGLSMGGMIGQKAALMNQSRFKSLSLCDTSSRVPPQAAPVWESRIRLAEVEGMTALIQQTIERWFSLAFEKQAKQDIHKIRNMIRDTPVKGFIGCCHAIAALDLTDQIDAIKLATLLVVGEDDPGTPVEAHEVIRDRISGSELVVLKNALHFSNIEQRDAFNETLVGFLDAQSR
jgi:3-oxoadipate enol-lactonase